MPTASPDPPAAQPQIKRRNRRSAGETKISNQIIETVASYVRQGNCIEPAALSAGISKNTLYSWLKRGNTARDILSQTNQSLYHRPPTLTRDDYMCARFLREMDAAVAFSERRDLSRIDSAADDPKHWKAAAWKLERRHPDRWGRKDSLEISGPNGGPIPHQTHLDLTRLTADEARTLQALLDKAQAQDDAAEPPRQIEAQVSEVGARADATTAGGTVDIEA